MFVDALDGLTGAGTETEGVGTGGTRDNVVLEAVIGPSFVDGDLGTDCAGGEETVGEEEAGWSGTDDGHVECWG